MGGLQDDYDDEVLGPFRESLVPLIHRSLQFFYSATPYDHIDHITLAGGTAHLPGLVDTLHSQLGTSVSIANPFINMGISKQVNESMLRADASALMLCAGLALRGFKHGKH